MLPGRPGVLLSDKSRFDRQHYERRMCFESSYFSLAQYYEESVSPVSRIKWLANLRIAFSYYG